MLVKDRQRCPFHLVKGRQCPFPLVKGHYFYSELTVRVSFLRFESACLRMGKSCKMVSFPLSWLTHKCCLLPLMEVRAHMATRVMEWEVRS